MTTIDLNSVTWTEAPAGYDQSGTLDAIQLGTIDDCEAIIALQYLDYRGTASLAINIDSGRRWVDTSSTQDWPEFDRLFGREHWQKFLTEWEEVATDKLKRDIAEQHTPKAYVESDESDNATEIEFTNGKPASFAEAFEDVYEFATTEMSSVEAVELTDEQREIDYSGEVTFTAIDGEAEVSITVECY